MKKIILGLAAAALVTALSFVSPASAAEKANGVTANQSQITDFSSWHRRWHRPRVVYRARPYAYRPYYRPYGYYRPYAYRPYGYYRPGVSFRFGF